MTCECGKSEMKFEKNEKMEKRSGESRLLPVTIMRGTANECDQTSQT